MGQGAGDAIESFANDVIKPVLRDSLEFNTLGALEFDDDFNIGPGDNTRESLRLTKEAVGELTGANAARAAQNRADAQTNAELARRAQEEVDQADFERRLDISASNRAASVRTGPSSGAGGGRTATRRTGGRSGAGVASAKVSGDFLGL